MAEYSPDEVFGQSAMAQASAPEQPKEYSPSDIFSSKPKEFSAADIFGGKQQQPQPSAQMPGTLEAAYEGLKESGQELGQSASAIAGSTSVAPAAQSPAAQPYTWSDLAHPIEQGLPKTVYRLAKGAPTITGGVLGGVAGTAVAGPGLGTLAGGAAGAGVVSAIQSIGPSFGEEMRKTPDDPNGAWDRALVNSGISGVGSATGWALFGGLNPFSGAIKNMAFQIFGVQPAVSMAEQGAKNIAADKPVTEGMTQAGVEGMVGTAVPMAGHAALRAIHGQDLASEAFDPMRDLNRDLQMQVAPMAANDATFESRAAAKDFANQRRLAVDQWNREDTQLRKLTPEQRQNMWNAADEESVYRQLGVSPEELAEKGQGLASLPPDERGAVEALQGKAEDVFNQAKEVGIVGKDIEGLPSYVPRMVAQLGMDGDYQNRGVGGIKTTTPQMRERKYMFAEETEQAAQKALNNPNAQLVRDIRTLPMATARLQEAVAGRQMINTIKELGAKTGQDVVSEDGIPANSEYKWFTIDHPAFKKFEPHLQENSQTGKMEPVHDNAGNIVFDKKPIYIRSDFEGPLKAVLSQGPNSKIYNGLMDLKGKSMGLIMYSPAIHNVVEWGRAFPAMPGKVATGMVYFEGNRAKNDPAIRDRAILEGIVPIGRRYGIQDITGMAEEPNLQPGRSWTAKGLGSIADVFSSRAGDKVRSTVDNLGDIWHNKLLWERVEDLQFGLYKNLRDRYIQKGVDEDSAGRLAAHLANRYAGAVPLEAMSQSARKLANLVLFSRSFTLGNLGAMKDMISGLPRDVQAQIMRNIGPEGLGKVTSLARRKAISIVAMDIALSYISNSALQSGISYLRGYQDWDQISKGYLDRMQALLRRTKEHPLEVLAHPFSTAESLTEQGQNEPGKRDRILVGYQKDGTAIYARSPVGKIGEEFVGWPSSPFDMLKRKLGTFARPTYQTFANDKGFGRKVYDPYAETSSENLRNIGSIVGAFMEAQFPEGSVEAARDLAVGEGSEDSRALNAYKVVGPLAGITFSKGAPGGPAEGEVFRQSERQRIKEQAAMPDIHKDIANGNMDRAIQRMQDLKMDPRRQRYVITSTLNPNIRLSKSQLRKFYMTADPDTIIRFEHSLDLQRQSQP